MFCCFPLAEDLFLGVHYSHCKNSWECLVFPEWCLQLIEIIGAPLEAHRVIPGYFFPL